jgi:hypothetical protein
MDVHRDFKGGRGVTWVSRHACVRGGETVVGARPESLAGGAWGKASTSGPMWQRERARAAAGDNVDKADPLVREEKGEAGTQLRLPEWAKRPRGRGLWSCFPFSFILNYVFLLFLFSLFNSNSNMPQAQIWPFQTYASNKNKVWVHDATIHSTLEFYLLEYYYISK